MVTKKGCQKWMYEFAAKSRFLNLLFLPIIAFGVVSWATKFPVNLKASPWLYIPTALLGLLSFFAGILVWSWYSVWFRYLAYGVARVISGIRSFLSSTVVQLVIIMGLSAWFWVWRKSIYSKDSDSLNTICEFLREILKLDSLLKILVIAAALFTMWKLFQSRKRIVICDFENFTDKKELDPVVKGLASICSNEMSRLSKLLKTYDDIHPDATKDMAKVDLNLDVQDIGKDFEQIIGEGSSLKIANINVPIGYLYGFFRKILHGPMLTGGVHLKGDKFTLTASLKGGKYKGNWQISFEEIETPPNSESEQLNKLTERLVCRMLTDLSPEITPRWKAMYHFTEGLRLFRETLLTEEKRKWNLIKAKDAFSQAVRDDEKFVQCYYNFGYIYRKLKSDEAAEAAFREALKKKPDYHQCYYQLADIYCENYYISEINKGKKCDKLQKEYSLSDAQWFCQQAVTICPSEPSYWDLLAGICYYKRWKKAPDEEVINSSITGTMLAWRALCKSIIKGEKTSKYKDTALSCIRNLAVLTGWKGKWSMWSSRCLYGQAIFLDPDNNDLHFMKGKSFYRPCKTDGKSRIHEGKNPHSQVDNKNKVEIDKKNAKKAYNAFKRVFEDDVDVDDPFSFWAFYINVNAKLYEQEEDKKKKKEYEDVVDDGYIHFLDAAAEIIHKDKSCQDGMIEQNEGLVSEALELIKVDRNSKKHKKDKDVIVSVAQKPMEEDNKARRKGLLYELRKLMQSNRDIVKWKKETSQLINRFEKQIKEDLFEGEPQIKSDFFTWMKIQIDIKSALLLLQTRRKPSCYKAKEKLESAINELNVKYPNELKILGLYMHLATAYLLLDFYDEALKASRDAVRLNPYDSDIRKVLGEVYIKLKDYNQAIHELQICFHLDKPELNILQKKDILEKIGEAYIKEGKILRDPVKRKKSFEEAAKFFKECHDIIEDKSYDKDTQEYKSYIETLGRTHFNLGYFYRQLLQYDDAISHYQTALEMAKALKRIDGPKRTDYILKTLLRMGWVYIEIQAFAEAERTFNNAASEDKQQFNQEDALLMNVEIDIGIMFSKVERVIAFGKNTLSEDGKSKETLKTIKDQVGEKIEDIDEDAQKKLDNIIAQIPLDDTNKEGFQKLETKKARLLALYHECVGRFKWKQGELVEAEKEFEKSIFYMPNPRVYLYLAEVYLPEVPKYRIGRKETLLSKARNACNLCRKHDLRQQYKQDVDDLEKKLDALEK